MDLEHQRASAPVSSRASPASVLMLTPILICVLSITPVLEKINKVDSLKKSYPLQKKFIHQIVYLKIKYNHCNLHVNSAKANKLQIARNIPSVATQSDD